MQDPEDDLTHDIVARIQNGDREAWTGLWDRLHDDLLFSIRCRLGPKLREHLESEDIFQSVALEALREVPQFAPRGAGAFRHFLNVLVRRKIVNRAEQFAAKKRAGTRPLVDEPEAPAIPVYRDKDRYEALERALAGLDEEQREVVVSHRVEGVPTKDLALRLGRSDASVRKIYSRALARLRVLLGAP